MLWVEYSTDDNINDQLVLANVLKGEPNVCVSDTQRLVGNWSADQLYSTSLVRSAITGHRHSTLL